MRFRWACRATEVAIEFEAESPTEFSGRATRAAQRLRVLSARPYHDGRERRDRAAYPAIELHLRWRDQWLHLSAPPAGLAARDIGNGARPVELEDAAEITTCAARWWSLAEVVMANADQLRDMISRRIDQAFKSE